MNRQQLEHIIRAAAVIAEDDEIVIVGSQSVLGQFPQAPRELLLSMEADVYPRRHPERSELIDGSIRPETVLERLAETELTADRRELAGALIRSDAAG